MSGLFAIASAITAAALHQIEVKMICVFAVIAGSEDRGEIRTGIGAHAIEQAFLAEGEEAGFAHCDALSIVQNDFGYIDGIAAGMLRHLRATTMVHCSAGIATRIVNGVDSER